MTPTRLFDFIEHQRKNAPLKKAFTTKYNGIWTSISTEEFCDQAKKVSRALISLGIEAQDKIAMISSTNRTEWNIVDIGLLTIGAVNVPIYPTISSEDYEYILNHSESEYCFVSDQEVYDKVIAIKDKVKSLKKVYSFDSIKGCSNWKELIELGTSSEHDTVLEERKIAVAPEDLATIIYTSGTTGIPKGVMLSHDNVVSNVLSSSKRLPLNIGQASALSFLPICHIFERVILYIYMQNSVSVYYAESLEKIADNLREIKPNVMTAVPRLLEKVYDKIYARGAELTGIKQKLFYWAVDLGLQYEPYGENGAWYEFKLKIAKKLILSKWKEALGGNLELIASGSAALQPRLARIFTAAGMTLVEGYGLTETSPVISVNDMRKNKFKIGSVGQIIDGVHVKIAKDGEILCKGPNIMMGYYKDLEKTAEVMTDDYFHTGDIGEIDKQGFLKITDRKKEMFKTSGGKYISPQVIENIMKQSLFIEQIMVVGDGRKMPTALIQPNIEYVMKWLADNGTPSKSLEEACKEESLLKALQKEIENYNEKFGSWERIKKFELVPEEWSIDAGHLTPTMKLKRKVVKEKYFALIEKMYSS
ncbi:long-chain fatty acid--CoA ligase [Flavobacteriaceae bacterium]|nr:long-chain fatty acid--CoA ligase [Flavobacteriaceae bacterium]MDB4255355.1 long-chain fatty acid--CoA ligase [Flavobacteriaceae bacterium]MDC1392646.1 long-chain fatty acid--CoA ligase [Flavobacteriaceae bacterium]